MNLSNKNIGLVGGVVGIFLLAIAAAWWIVSPSWQALFGVNGDDESRAHAQSLLMEWQVPYEIDEENGYLLLKETDIAAVRGKLAEMGIPSENNPGLEIFSETEYGMSEFTQRINYRRAIEAEISKTIRSFADVRSARVHLTIPKETIFKDRQAKPKASVVIQPKVQQSISEEQVQGITQLVASSVEGLEPGQVTVLDENGVVLTNHDDSLNGKKKYSSRNLEFIYKQKAMELVKGIVQSDDVKVAVNAEINYDRVKSVKEQILPRNEKVSGHLKHKRQQISQPKSSDKKVSSNSNSVVEEEYLFSTERSEIEYASGQIERLTVGIVVAKELDEASIQSIKNVIEAGLGLNTKRGDLVTVVTVKPVSVNEAPIENHYVEDFNRAKDDSAPAIIKQADDKTLLYVLIGGGLLLLIILLAVFLSRGSKNEVKQVELSEDEKAKLLQDVKSWLSAGSAQERS